MSPTSRDDELDLGDLDEGCAPLSRPVREGVHPWSPTALKAWERGEDGAAATPGQR